MIGCIAFAFLDKILFLFRTKKDLRQYLGVALARIVNIDVSESNPDKVEMGIGVNPDMINDWVNEIWEIFDVDGSGDLSINRIVAATDCGTAVNPQQIEAQIEGSFVYGLSAALYGEITYENGQVQQDNFHTYPSMRIKDMPEVHLIVMPSGGFYGGVGEPTISVAAPAVLNAIFAATGTRIRTLPRDPRRVYR